MVSDKIKAVVFDLDGTLLNTVLDIGAGANTALHRFGMPERSVEEYCRYVGNGIRTLFRRACPEGTPDDVYEQALAFYLAYYPENCTVHTAYYPHVRETLKRLEAAGYQLAVISNKTEGTARKIMDHFFPDIRFSFIWGNNGSRPLKPATDAGVLACETLGVSPEEVLYVGDGDTDMEFGSRMGFYAAAATWGYRSREQLLAAGADVLLESMDDIPAILHMN